MIKLIPAKRLNALLEILPDREMPQKTKEAARLVIESGFTYELAALKVEFQVSAFRLLFAN